MKKSIRYLTLLLGFLSVQLCAHAQFFKPTWVNDIGGTGDSKATNIALDNSGNVYISGYIRGTVTFNIHEGGNKTLTSRGDADIYIAKYNIASGAYQWAISMGGPDIDLPNSMALDNAGNVLITGQFSSTANFNQKGSFPLTSKGVDDIFIAKYTSNGDFVWAKDIGEPGIDRGHYITTDNQNNVIITASYSAAIDVDPSAGVTTLPSQNALACFFAKYDSNGNFVWAHPLGAVNQQNLTAVTIDKTTNDVVVAGDFMGNVDFSYTGNPDATFNSPGISNFVARYASDGSYKWVNYLPGSGSGIVSSVKIDNQSNIIITGSFGGQLYPDGPNGNPLTAKGTSDVLLASYKQDGSLNWAQNFGGNGGNANIRYVTVDENNNIYITGYFTGTITIDPALSDGVLTNSAGGNSVLIAGFSPDGKATSAGAFGNGCSSNYGYEIAAGGGSIYVAGSFCQIDDFDTGSCQTFNYQAVNGTSDSFLTRYTIGNSLPGIITSFTIAHQSSNAGVFNTGNPRNIDVFVTPGTDVTHLVPNIVISNNGPLSPASGVPQDFTNPVIYTLGSSCSSVTYRVKVFFDTFEPPVNPPSNPTVCATSGIDGPLTTGSVVNTYYPPQGNITLSAGGKSVKVAAVPANNAQGISFGATPIKAGDLVMLIQVQDATINNTNDDTYGGPYGIYTMNSYHASGYTDAGNTGKFEYVLATNNVPLTGGTLNFKGSGLSGGTVYTYTNAVATATRGQASFQVIRVPQYSNLRLTANITTPQFNGKLGGVIAINSSGNIDFNGFTIDANAKGFRGGYSLVKNTVTNVGDLYVAPVADDRVSGKGEGIAGTPRYVWDGFSAIDNGIEGYPGGSGGRGAPASGGGGGNDAGSGGGGGGNGGDGGVGGDGNALAGGTTPNGGRPGSKTYNSKFAEPTRLALGGGGGGGYTANAIAGIKGGVGGGIVIINANTMSGSGTITANGTDGADGVSALLPQGAGGGGAGGAVFMKVAKNQIPTTVKVIAAGGKGGNTVNDVANPYGPGGGGGGGLVFHTPSASNNQNLAFGFYGKSNSGAGTTHNAEAGDGGSQILFDIPSLPAYLGGNGSCLPALTTKMSIVNPAVDKTSNGTATYQITITNDPSGGAAGGIKASCALPTGFAYQSATITYNGLASGPATIANTGTPNQPIFGSFYIPAGDNIVITLNVTIGCVATGKYNSSAQALYLDPTRDYTAPARLITAETGSFGGQNIKYQDGSGTVPGLNYNGAASTNEDANVVNNTVTNNTISTVPAAPTYCAGDNPAIITGSTPTSASPFTYQWQSSPDGITFTDIAGIVTRSYDPPSINTTTYYRRAIISSVCPAPLYSNIITITVQPAVANNTITAPAVVNFCASGDPDVITGSAPTGGDGIYKYQWQQSTNGGSIFTDIAGAASIDYDPPPLTATTIFRRVVTSGACTTPVFSNRVTITITNAVSNITLFQPATTLFCNRSDFGIINGNAPGGGNGVFQLQWQSSPDGITYTNIPGATKNDYPFPKLTATTYYRLTATSGNCSTPAVSLPVIITIEQGLSNNSIITPAVTAFCGPATPDPITGTLPAGGNGVYKYQWQSSPDGGAFKDIAGATNQDYQPPLLTATTYYQRAVTSSSCTIPLISNQVMLTVQPALTGNTITAPAITAFCGPGNPGTITGNIPTGGNGSYSFQWQMSADNLNFNDISGETNKDINLLSVNTTGYYRRMVTSGVCTTPLPGNVVTITVVPVIANNTVSTVPLSPFCVSSDPDILITGSVPTGGDGTYAYQWQKSADNVTFSNIAGEVSKDYTPPIVASTTYYRRTVTSGFCNIPAASNVITVTVSAGITKNTLAAPAVGTFCTTGDAVNIVGSTPSGGDGTYNYQWQGSTDNISFADIAGVTAKDYDPPVATSTFYYRRAVTSGSCKMPDISNAITITVLPELKGNALFPPLSTQFCANADPVTINGSVGTGGTSTINYQWQNSPDGVTYKDIAGANSPDYDPPLISSNTYYRRMITSGVCNVPLASNVIMFSISGRPANPTTVLAQPGPVCSGNSTTISVTVPPPPGVVYNWYDSETKDNLLFTGQVFKTLPLTATTTYYVEAMNSNGCTSSLQKTQVNVVETPLAPQTTSSPYTLCNGSDVLLSVANKQPGLTYNWYTAATLGSTIFSGPDYRTPVISASTDYYVEAVNGFGCPSPRTKVSVILNPLPQVVVQGNATCPGTSASLTVTAGQNNTINWYASATGGSILFTGSPFNTPPVITNTTYYAEAVDKVTGCVSATRSPAQAQILLQLATPVVNVGSVSATSITFEWAAVPGATAYQVSVDNGQTFIDPSSGGSGLSHTITGLDVAQSVTIIVHASGVGPCQLSENSVAVTGTTYNPLQDQVFVANAFTPNGDGNNDVVYVHSPNIIGLKFYVYDQWGELMFTGLSPQSGWDGFYKGKRAPVGVYVYYLEATMADSKVVKKKGSITLLR